MAYLVYYIPEIGNSVTRGPIFRTLKSSGPESRRKKKKLLKITIYN